MRLSTFDLIGRFCLISLCLTAGTTRASEVLAKLLKPPATLTDQPYHLFGENVWHITADIRGWDDVAYKPNAALPGFRTTSVGDSAFISGWITKPGDTTAIADGFLTKVDAAGGVLWTKKMKEIIPATAAPTGRVWKINDIEAVADRLYVCGEDGPDNAPSRSLDGYSQDLSKDPPILASQTRGFLASLSLEGVLLEYVLFDVPATPRKEGVADPKISNGKTAGQARACALSVATVNGVRIITVIGDAQSNETYNEAHLGGILQISDRRLSGGSTIPNLTLYNGSHANADYRREALRYGDRDIFVARFTADLTTEWATTLGFMGDDFASSVASDNTGAVFLGVMTHPNAEDNNTVPDHPNPNPLGEFDDVYPNNGPEVHRVVYQRSTGAAELPDTANSLFGNWDRNPDAAGFVWRLDTRTSKLTHSFMTSPAVGDSGRQGRVTGLVYVDGSLYAAGESRGGMRPRSDKRADGSAKSTEKFELAGSGTSSDIWVTRLSPDDLSNHEWRFFRSTGDDYVTELTAGADGIYLAGFAGGSLESFPNTLETLVAAGATLTPPTTGTALTPESSSAHTFWHKLGRDLGNEAHIIPSSVIPEQHQLAGITPVGGNLLITGGWETGYIFLGPADTQKKLTGTGWNGFAGFLKPNGTWLEEVDVTINSAYGAPTPHKGQEVVAGNTPMTATVPAEVYEDEHHVIINSSDQDAINSRAVYKRVCTGYYFTNNTLAGTSNSVSFIATADTELTFTWRTEFAIEIESDLRGTEGLTSTAAGNPSPAVQKHWYRENASFTAFIDGAASKPEVPGVRWRSTGYEAYGAVASTDGIGAGFRAWPSLQPVQQTPKITISDHGRIRWKWAKEHSLRVAANTAVTDTAGTMELFTTVGDTPPVPTAFKVTATGERQWTFPHPVDLTRIRVLTRPDFDPAKVGQIALLHDGTVVVKAQTVPDWQPSTYYVLNHPPISAKSAVWSLHGQRAGVPVDPMLDFVEVVAAEADPPSDVRHGSGEFWFPAGAMVTASAPPSITTTNPNNTLALKGYVNGFGSVSPFNGLGVSRKIITLNSPGSITWNYAKFLYQTHVAVGKELDFAHVEGLVLSHVRDKEAPTGGSVSQGPSGSGVLDMWEWDDKADKLYVLRPGIFTAEFKNADAPADPASNIIVEITSEWPDVPDYTHIMEAPGVPLESDQAQDRQFLSMAYTAGGGVINDGAFSATERGHSVLRFSRREGGVATGNLLFETLSPKVVKTVSWTEAIKDKAPKDIGTAITSTTHEAAVGHNGYVINNTAPVNARIYDRASLLGPIIPVNRFDSDPASPPRPPATLPAGIVVNGGFESAAFFGWGGLNSPIPDLLQTGHPALGSLTPPEGAYVASIKSKWDASYIQTTLAHMTLTAGKKYMVTIRTNATDAGIAQMHVLVNQDETHATSVPVAHAVEWGTVAVPFIATAENNTLRISNHADTNTTLLIDDIQVTEFSAPLAVAWYRVQDGLHWPYASGVYSPQWPATPDRIVIASQLGSEGLKSAGGPEQPLFEAPGHTQVQVYSQADPTAMGYNPDEEHSLIAPSFLEGTRRAAFALHNDLNVTTLDATYTSEPYVLVQYVDATDPGALVPKMHVYAVIEQDAATTDPRLKTATGAAAYNQKYTFHYEGTAGQRLFPPHPLTTVIGPGLWPKETAAVNVDHRISFFRDKKRQAWIVSGDTDPEEDIRAVFYYPMRAEWWHPSKTLAPGEAVVFAKPTKDHPRNVFYNTVWPADVAVLKAGETLTFSGGEYATDHNAATPRPQGLPQAVAWQSARVEFDSSNPTMDAAVTATRFYARAANVLSARKVPLALSSVPDNLKPASGNVTVEGLIWRFKQLPASLQNRIFYHTGSQTLGVEGVLNGRTIGDGDLLAAPGAQTILQPNILTAADQVALSGLSVADGWKKAANDLGELSRSPEGAVTVGSLGVGLKPHDPSGASYAQQNGPGIAVVTNPDLLEVNTAALNDLPDNGYITIAENNDPALGDAPVAIHVIKVVRQKYRGSIAVLEPDNAFDEKVSLQHTGDFGGDVGDLVFEWRYREEDGRDLNPPGVTQPTGGTPLPTDWTLFNAPNNGRGQNVIQLAGASSVLITDNVFFCRYRHNNSSGDVAGNWSAWAGAANSREPKPGSPSAATDAAYVAQLAPGWVKRVTNAVNVFDARIKDFRNNNAPATYTSMIQQAGQRWEGPVAFNPQKDAIENVGMIELYQTVLDRAEALSIVSAPATTGVGTALLNAANRIAGLYTLLGNEAMADALDPTVGYSTQGGQFGSLAPTIHAFQNQVPNLLEEELALLRGRGETGARPGYNRLVWNFTNGTGEAAYALNYAISDLTNDGFINDADARRLYPQGHGDAWGHYTMAMEGYYKLSVNPNFTWVARSEKFNIDGVVLDVDYLDERAFAKTAAARAQCGSRLVDLTYRQAYTENPNGQWQGYRDVNTDRAWGVVETAQRVGTAAYCDWILANALLKENETDSAKTGIRKVDRQTVGELRLIASEAESIRSVLAAADRGMNPAGLDPNVVPFDIDPVLTDRTNPNAATHFEQIYQRAVGANQNALQAFNHASEAGKLIRQTAASTESLRQQTIDQDLSYRNQLIEIFGTPYDGQVGPGKAYPEGYKGPDLYLFMYVDQLTTSYDNILGPLDGDMISTTIVPGLRNLATDTNPTTPVVTPADKLLADTLSTYFPADVPLPSAAVATIPLQLPRSSSDYAFKAPAEWGARQSPGEIQAAVQNLVQAEWKLRTALDAYEGTSDDFKVLLRTLELKSGIAKDKIRLAALAEETQDAFHNRAVAVFAASEVIQQSLDQIERLQDDGVRSLPTVLGLAADPSYPIRAVMGIASALVYGGFRATLVGLHSAQYRYELEADEALVEMDQALLTQDLKAELVDLLGEIYQLANDEADLRMAAISALEDTRAAAGRVGTAMQRGQALIEQRTVFNQRVASRTTQMRYEDMTFRIMHHEALRKYQSSFDLASRYAYLAGKAYQYELNLPDNHAANATPLLSGLLRNRTLGQWNGASPVINQGGIAESLAVLKGNYEVLKGQLGFNNPQNEVHQFSVRSELCRIGLSSRVNADWRTKLETWRVPDLWNYQYQNNGVNYGYVYRRFCRPFAPEAAGAQPALVIPFDSSIAAGKNWFGKDLAGGDSAFNASVFSTKIRSVGVRLDGYNNTALSQTPQVYFVPVGRDRMFLPDSATLEDRSWNVVDQRIPVPLPITSSNLSDPDWRPYTGSASGFFEEIRKFSSFRAYHDAAGYSTLEMLGNGRLVGRSVWNTQWVLIIPSASLLNDPANPSAGIDTLIYGAPLPGFNQSTAGTVNRDLGVRDLRILLQTYSISGN